MLAWVVAVAGNMVCRGGVMGVDREVDVTTVTDDEGCHRGRKDIDRVAVDFFRGAAMGWPGACGAVWATTA